MGAAQSGPAMHCHAARLHSCGDAIWTDPGGYSAGWWLGQGVYLLRFENSLGATVLRFRGAPVPPLAVEVLTRKLGDAADPVSHVALYRRLVADVLAALITLPFAVSGATGHTTEREAAPAGPLFTLHFFLRHGRALAAALQAIDYAPHRVLTREELLQPVARPGACRPGPCVPP